MKIITTSTDDTQLTFAKTETHSMRSVSSSELAVNRLPEDEFPSYLYIKEKLSESYL